MTRVSQRRFLLLLAAVAAAVVFTADILLETGVAGGASYLAVVWLAFAAGERRYVWATAAVCSLLTFVGLALSPWEGEVWKVLANRGLALFVIWVTAVLCLRVLQLLGEQTQRTEIAEEFAADIARQHQIGAQKRRAMTNIMEDLRIEREKLHQAMADLERRNADLDEFAYVASHDLRTPLEGVKNLSRWIIEDNTDTLPESSRKHLVQMQDRIERLERLLDDLLHYSRAGRIHGDIVEVDTTALVKETVELLNPPDGFHVRTNGKMPTFQTARTPLEQVLRNLIDNAVKHHDGDSGAIKVSCDDAGEFYEFAVEDDGPGIAVEFHNRVFKMFETLKPRDEVEGSGMGLAVIKKIVESYRGRVTLEPSDSRGAMFRFTWPKVIHA